MSHFRLAQAAREDLLEIRRYLLDEGGPGLSLHVRSEIMAQIRFLSENPGAGHRREDLTGLPVKFWSVYAYLIVYDPVTRPLGIARILHSSRDLKVIFERQPPKA